MPDKLYRVYRYQYHDMPKPRWGAQLHVDGVDSLPCSVLASPGILNIEARNKQEAIEQGRRFWREEERRTERLSLLAGGKGGA